MVTGAVGLPLPGVEVRIVMSNATHTTIVEGTHKETQVMNVDPACKTLIIIHTEPLEKIFKCCLVN